MPADDFIDIGAPTRVRVGPTGPTGPTVTDDAYPAIIADQRTMLPNGIDCGTAEDIFWKCWVPWAERHALTLQLDPEQRAVVPYINLSRWVADCPNCRGGMACWDANPYTCCLTCATICEVHWQSPFERAAVIRVLAGRPVGNRNWDAHKGETLDELKLENVLMTGVAPAERHGLLVAANVDIPTELTDANDWLERLRTQRAKANR